MLTALGNKLQRMHGALVSDELLESSLLGIKDKYPQQKHIQLSHEKN